MRLEDSQLVSGSQRAPTVYVDADLPGANRIARFLGDEGWEVVSGPSEIPPMSIPIVFFGPSTDVELWAKLLGSGGLRAIAVGDNADSDVVVGALEVGFDQFVDNSISDRLLLARIRSVAVLSEKSGCEGPDSLDSVVRRVRTKLENLEGIRRIRAVRGFGFILDDKV